MFKILENLWKYRKSNVPPRKLVTQKTLRKIAPPNISPGDLYLKIALKWKQTKQKLFSNTYIFAFAEELLRPLNDCSQKVSLAVA